MAKGSETMTLDTIDNDKVEHYIYIIAKEN